MKLSLPPLLSLATSVLAVSVSYDTGFDDGSRSLVAVACSDGPNGLLNRGYSTQGDLPKFPFIGGVPDILGWNSEKCGSCWSLTYNNKTIYVLGIDTGTHGFNIALGAMNELTHGQAVFLGRVDAEAKEAPASACGLK